MPKSQFVSASKLRPMIVYFALAFVVLLVADAALRTLAPGLGARRLIGFVWMVLLPLGGWLVWKRV
jgi:hypothetical protein